MYIFEFLIRKQALINGKKIITKINLKMELNKIIKILEEHNYKYQVKNQIIVVSLEFSQNVVIDLSNSSKIVIPDDLVNWNFLTGCIKMSLKNAILYNFVLLIFFGFFCQYAAFIEYNFTSLLLTFIAWVLLFSIFYLIKLESFKLQFKILTKEM
ncbi:hypothetical protein D0809_12640 [Flavobacterium circumlabens]|uniref:Uncharacterized protein n=2 Tax=Flavobacterium circumlabens TaxID=2133765 RepID=A0A4Y7UBD7_9FLAO|nr:hypothetical protein EV142_10476 [Flavobacterium circumlabens]TEB43740.1 hypothetical protein D0809_12640 [Flavobacterium circumlabens]